MLFGRPPFAADDDTVRRPSLRLYGQPRLLPSVEAAVEWVHALPTAIRQFLRHTGARRLVRSGAVGDDGAVARYLVQMLFNLIGRHADRAGQLDI